MPVMVEINAAPAPISQSTVHSTQTAQTAQPVQPAFRWPRHSDQLVEQMVSDLMQDRSQFPKSLTDALDEADWDTLKSGLRQVVEDWVDRQPKKSRLSDHAPQSSYPLSTVESRRASWCRACSFSGLFKTEDHARQNL